MIFTVYSLVYRFISYIQSRSRFGIIRIPRSTCAMARWKLAAIAAFLAMASVVQAQRDSCDGYPISQMNSIVRVNFGFAPVSNDLSTYQQAVSTTCPGAEPVCLSSELQAELAQLQADPISFTSAAEEGSYFSYLQSIGIIAAVGISFSILAFLISMIVLCVKCCKLCCPKPKEEAFDPDERMAQMERERIKVICLYLLLLAFVITNFAVILMLQVGGNDGWTNLVNSIVDAPDNTVSLAKSIPDTALSLISIFIGQVGVNSFNRIKTEIDVS